jgi:hypothetical protein
LQSGETIRLGTASPDKVFVGLSALPEWMSLKKL